MVFSYRVIQELKCFAFPEKVVASQPVDWIMLKLINESILKMNDKNKLRTFITT